ncbi:hypothetical protein E2C01_083734 [Portunus trituberculatus]|uniref:Uncharacterized protein n=1 Tax=Portunus trituberculatus TaxID=210409 RepID=A0A5B7J305_PORTR|nr:hypothetical protein [Portunus trituberculatus]
MRARSGRPLGRDEGCHNSALVPAGGAGRGETGRGYPFVSYSLPPQPSLSLPSSSHCLSSLIDMPACLIAGTSCSSTSLPRLIWLPGLYLRLYSHFSPSFPQPFYFFSLLFSFI